MNLDREGLQRDIHKLYRREHEELGAAGALAMLERAADFPLAPTLNAGGVLVFPHAGVKDCGHQIAACARACLDSGADRVLVVSVLHAFSDAMEDARQRVSGGGDPRQEELWGIQGPGLEGRQEWRGDHALFSWRHFWRAEMKRRGIDESRAPQVIERYPYLAGGRPGDLPGIDELARIAEDAVFVSTADAFHHGIGYGDAPGEAMWPDERGLAPERCWTRGWRFWAAATIGATTGTAWRPRATRATPARSFAGCAGRCAGASLILHSAMQANCTINRLLPGLPPP